MNNALSPSLPPISDSTFFMLRCVVSLIHADKIVKDQEIQFLDTMVGFFERRFTISRELKERLAQDMKKPQNIDRLLAHVTERSDREHLVLFTGMLAIADGDLHPAEEAILKKIRMHCADTNGPGMPEPQDSLPQVVGIDMEKFTEEVRDIVRQEYYREGIRNTGIDSKSRAVSVADAFVQRGAVALQEEEKPVRADDLGFSVRRTLMPEEQILYRARFHPIYMFETFLVSVLIFWAVNAALPHIFEALYNAHIRMMAVNAGSETLAAIVKSNFWPWARHWLGLLLGILFFICRVLPRWLTEIILTDRRILYKRGVLSVTFVKVDLRQLFEMQVNQSRLGAILNYGSAIIFTNMITQDTKSMDATSRNLQFPEINDPHKFCTAVDRARRLVHSRSV